MPDAGMLFILGCERSGSTWLSNIFDSHGNVEFWMEPFADYARLFPLISGRNMHSNMLPEADAPSLRELTRILGPCKYPLFHKRGRSAALIGMDRFLLGLWDKLGFAWRGAASSLVNRYRLLNLNWAASGPRGIPKKSGEVRFEVVKELRLNFKVPLLHQVWPHARYLLPIRHPGAQISSILRLFSQGKLQELAKSLDTLPKEMLEQERFKKYHGLINAVQKTSTLERNLSLWWLFNYDILLKDLSSLGLPFELVRHESLSADPLEVCLRIFSFAQIPMADEVKNYIGISSTAKNSGPKSTVDTLRDSRIASQLAIADIDPALMTTFQEVFSSFVDSIELHPSLRDYVLPFLRLSQAK